MRPPVGLQVKPDDLDGADLLDAGRQEVDLRPDEVGDREGFVAREHVDPNVSCRGELGVDGRLDRVDEVARHRLELEVHPARPGFHVAAGHLGTVVAPDDPAQGMQRRVGAHQRQATCPVDIDGQRIADRRRLVIGRQLMRDLAIDLPCAADGPRSAVGRADDQATIRRLAATSRVEDRPVEHDRRRGTDLHVTDEGGDGPGVGVGVAELLAGRRHRGRVVTRP